ncbi:MAG: TIGR02646 family protein [Methylococcales bacterium]|nr:TIGR02646 family protein [Methylococcales bacterium]
MKRIIKTSSPTEFEAWKIRNKFTKDDLLNEDNQTQEQAIIWKKFTKNRKVRKAVKQSLLDEQGFICCYCQQRVEFDENTTIEHFVARENDAVLMFEYDNILACCDGGQKQRTEQQIEVIPKYCGHEKASKTIAINPLDENCEAHFAYSFNPDSLEISVEGLSEQGKNTIEKLNLNTPKLRTLRGETVAGFIFDENGDYISNEDANIIASQIKIQKVNNQFEPFCVVLEYILKNL